MSSEVVIPPVNRSAPAEWLLQRSRISVQQQRTSVCQLTVQR